MDLNPVRYFCVPPPAKILGLPLNRSTSLNPPHLLTVDFESCLSDRPIKIEVNLAQTCNVKGVFKIHTQGQIQNFCHGCQKNSKSELNLLVNQVLD